MRRGVASTLTAGVVVLLAAAADPVDMSCVLSNCGSQASACLSDPSCQAVQECMKPCAAGGAADYTACNNLCFFAHASETFGELATCAIEYSCYALSITTSASGCPADMLGRPRALDFNTSMLADAEVMFVAAGADPVNDCRPCQMVEFELMPDGGVVANWSFWQDGKGSSTTYWLNETAPGVHTTRPTLFSMSLQETHCVLDYTEDGSYFFYVYCGDLLGSPYIGAAVSGRDAGAPLPAELAARFAQAVRDAGLQDLVPFEQYCTPVYDDSCTNIYRSVSTCRL